MELNGKSVVAVVRLIQAALYPDQSIVDS